MRLKAVICAIVLTLGAFATPAVANRGQGAQVYFADLDPLNNSGVSGFARLILKGNELTVILHVRGVEPGMVHPQHIHGFEDDTQDAVCPTMAADMNGDNLISLEEGLPFYGPVLLPLDPFPVPDDHKYTFVERYTLGTNGTISREELLPLENRVIVVHGMTVDGQYIPTLPVACGEIRENNGNGHGNGNGNGNGRGRGRGRN